MRRCLLSRPRWFVVLSAVFFLFSSLFFSLPLSAQGESYSRPIYSNSVSAFPNFLKPYSGRTVPPPNFTNTPRIDQLLQNGRIMLSLDDAIALALENNLDLAIARYNLSIADTDILRTKSGAAVRGVSTGVITGTPGGNAVSTAGAPGAGAGGTATGAGGAGAGTLGLVSSTTGVGAPVPSFDPTLTSTLSLEHSKTPQPTIFITGVPFLQQNTTTANFTYSQAFVTGTQFSVGYNNARIATNNLRSAYEPILNANFRFTIQQPLLSGFGLQSNARFLRIAKNNREISDVAFRLQVVTTVTQIENIYWDLVNAYEDVKVKQQSVDLANKLLSDTQKQVQIGTLAPIEIVNVQSQLATSKQDLIVSQTNLQLQQLLMLNAVSRNLSDPVLASAPVVPTDTMELPVVEPVVPTQDLIADALSHRAELAESRIDLTNRNINQKSARNAQLPSVSAFAWYGTAAIAGPQNPLSNCLINGNQFGCSPPFATTGYSDALSTMFGGDFPDYAVGFNVNIPILNRSAQADQVRSELEYRQAEMRLQQQQNQIRIEVRNAQFTVQQNRARVDAANAAVALANQTLDAEQKKYALGTSTSYNVLQAQRDLAQAESNLVTARAAYEKSRVELDRATGLTLTRLGIEIAEAETGSVKTLPKVPGVVPRPADQNSPVPGAPPLPAPPTTPAAPAQTPPAPAAPAAPPSPPQPR